MWSFAACVTSLVAGLQPMISRVSTSRDQSGWCMLPPVSPCIHPTASLLRLRRETGCWCVAYVHRLKFQLRVDFAPVSEIGRPLATSRFRTPLRRSSALLGHAAVDGRRLHRCDQKLFLILGALSMKFFNICSVAEHQLVSLTNASRPCASLAQLGVQLQ